MYVASDYEPSRDQMYHHLSAIWPSTIRLKGNCHVDLHKTNNCMLITIGHWFILGLSDKIVTQGADLPYSAYSRYAGLYSLSSDVFYLGSTCSPVNNNVLARQSAGNWKC